LPIRCRKSTGTFDADTLHGPGAAPYWRLITPVKRLCGDSVQVQPLFLSFDPRRLAVHTSGGDVMSMRIAETTGYVRHREPEVQLMPTTRLEDELRSRARELIKAGRLRCGEHYRTWGGRGSNEPCALCDAVIKPDEVEYEIEFIGAHGAGVYRFHLQCHDAWQHGCTAAL
jgi:hypothetical protein